MCMWVSVFWKGLACWRTMIPPKSCKSGSSRSSASLPRYQRKTMSVGAREGDCFFVLQPVFAEVYWSPVQENFSVLLLHSNNLFCCYNSPTFIKEILLSTYSSNSTNKPDTGRSFRWESDYWNFDLHWRLQKQTPQVSNLLAVWHITAINTRTKRKDFFICPHIEGY